MKDGGTICPIVLFCLQFFLQAQFILPDFSLIWESQGVNSATFYF